ncbi:MAG TPA: DHA2 family efflux MFS transporter permease subunit [Myxococcales bacterium]|nr:DHA2 family efflux MFS transporter permease subunit [Myxococcales bacterium]
MSSIALPSPLHLVAARPERKPVNKWLVTVSVSFGTLMGAIDASIVNVALTHIRGSVGATLEEITWISTAFVVATVLVMPLTAFLGRLVGQKRLYMISLAVFLAGSALCGMAHSLWMLVAFRVVQGLGAGALQPTEQAILRQTFPPQEQGMAMALFGMAVMLGPAFGPTLGGIIVDSATWPWIFYINLPVGALGLFLVWRFVHEPEDIRAANVAAAAEQKKHLDWQGIALLSVGLCTLQYLLEEGDRSSWFESRVITACAIIAALSLVAFVMRELSARVPAVNLGLFKDPVFASGTLIGAVMFAMLMANMFLLPVFMQEMLGFTATQSGVHMMPRSLVMMAVTPLIGRLYNKVSPRLLVGLGVLAFSVGAYQMSHFTLDTGTAQIVTALVWQGMGFSLLFVPLTTVALSRIPRAKLTDATGLNSLLRQIGGSVGLAIFATALGRTATQARASLRSHLSLTSPDALLRLQQIQQALVGRGMDAQSAQAAAPAALASEVARQAMVISFEKMFLLAGICFMAILPLLLFLKVDRSAEAGSEKPEVHLEM